MKTILTLTIVVFALLFCNSIATAQCTPLPTLSVVNPSFEGTPQPHITPGPWTNCHPGQTPDTQPGSWGVTLPASNGSSYLGLVHQPSSGWQEGASEALSSPMVAGTTYNFTIDLANSSSTQGGIDPGCAECQIWGSSNSECDQTVLLWSSGNITSIDAWQTYNVTITPTQNFPYISIYINSLGCSTQPYILVDNITPIIPVNNVSAPTIINSPVTCAGSGNNGVATVHATGIHPPFQFLWNSVPAQTDSVLDNVGVGTYTVTVTDANGCTATGSVVMNLPAPVVTPTVTNVNCFGQSTGGVSITTTGGNGTINYAWSNAAGNVTSISGVPIGTYTVTATDASSCTASASALVTQPAQITIPGNAVSATCTVGGTIAINPAGGVPAYSYSWSTSPVQTTQLITNLGAGPYTVTVTDANSCTASASFTVGAAPNAPTINLTPVNPLCFGQNNGRITAVVGGGTPGYSYSWNTAPVQTTAVANGLIAGTYNVTVTDAVSCTASANATLTEPALLTAVTSKIDILCFGQSTGSTLVTPGGGTVNYTYNWNTTPVQTTALTTSVPAGTYNVTVTDAHNCTVSSTITVNQPAAPLTVTETNVDVLCFGNATGSANATAAGGTVNYSYAWNTTPVQTTTAITSLVAGTYTITVTDANGCTATVSSLITQPAQPLAVNTTFTAPVCFGQPAATATANATGGTVNYSYNWNSAPAQNTQTATNLPQGNYTVTVTDLNNCTASSSVVIPAAPTQVTATTTQVDVLCFGNTTGSATIIPAGGAGNYTYNWNSVPAQTTITATALGAGTYDFTVSDMLSCTATGSVTIIQPAAPLTVTETNVDVLCFGDATGSATATAAGGTTNYSYSWNTTPVQTTSSINTIVAGIYTLTVTDAHSCTATVSSDISQPATPVTVTSSIAAPLCFGQPTTTASSNASGGVPGYNYAWNTVPAQNTQNIINVPAGTFTVTATDANNCTATSSIVVSAPPTQLTLVTSHLDVLCFGDATGSATVIANGSWGTYSYNWNSAPVQTTAVATQLIAGTYDVTVTDINGCSATGTETIAQPASALSIVTSKVDVLCFGDATGSAAVVASGATPGYTYNWSTTPAQTTAAINAIVAGTYTVTVTDANSCSLTGSAVITQPATPLTATKTSVDVDCNGANNGSIAVTASGGTAAYSYVWSVVPSVNSPNATALSPGNYSITTTDANGCTFAINNMVISEPTALAVSPVITNVSCPNHGDGEVDLNPSGGTPPYTFVWNNGKTSPGITNLSGGVYDATVTDSHGCPLTNSATVIELPGLWMNAAVKNVLCFPLTNGAIDVTASSSFLPLQFSWDNGAVTEDLMGLDTGLYHITITDSHGCTVDSLMHVANDNIFSIDATPDTVTVDLGHAVALNVVPMGSVFGTVTWTPSNGLSCSDCVSPVSSTNESITYYVTGIDTNGCVANDVVRVNVVPNYIAFIPNAFTPNGDGNNDFFEVFGNKEAWKQFEVEVYDRWGEKVFESNDMNFKWDGTYKGTMMNPGVLVYTVKVIYLNNYSDKLFKGTVTLVR